MLEPSTSSSSTTASGTDGRPRRPPAKNNAPRSTLVDGATGMRDPSARSATAPSPGAAWKRSPDLSSWTTPNPTSPSRASSDGGTTATDTQQDSSPAAAGRVPSTGSTTKNARGRP